MSWIESQFYQSLNSQSAMVIALAFMGGVASSFLPCTIAMLPVLVGYVGGYSEDSKLAVFIQVSLFITGLAITMTILGIIASLLGITFGTIIGGAWYYIIGLLAIVMGLNLLGVFHIPLPQFITKHPDTQASKIIAPLLLGVTFGLASSPCGTPFLAGILGLISSEHNLLIGGASLFCYALGQSALLLVVGMFTGLLKHIATLRQVGNVINKLSAIVFIGVGLIIIATGAGLMPNIVALPELLFK
jgi:cytochrome c-type biogenesis protein